MKTIWITKYALTNGIIKAEAEAYGLSRDIVRVTSGKYAGTILSKNGWCGSHEEAVAKAEDMRRKKILSLQKQADKLTRMQFE